ncbi:General alpha-glucoside permease [Colletotrichum higginsianum]|uniref:General alpha-glucoside permease n=1 Tax=Colletotrichum higginsianum TaxID=80884 RepID=A0A4T0VDJ7_9PEZI|nr:General alpha-glucoside permease [Colletotrichum higginsianum]
MSSSKLLGGTDTDSGSSRCSQSSDVDLVLEEVKEESHGKPLSTWMIMALTCPNFGLQAAWLLLMSSGTPHLHSLGISDAVTALVWLTGPLFGAFVQPVLGRLSDRSRHPWGLRKPFILCGASCVAACLLALACTEDLTGDHVGVGTRPKMAYGMMKKAERSHLLTQGLAVLWVCVMTFAIQAFQMGVRALVVDACPPAQQVRASAWSTRWNGLGSVCLALVGYADARWTLFGVEGSARIKTLAALVAVSIAATVSLMCYVVPDKPRDQGPVEEEKREEEDDDEEDEEQTLWQTCRSVWSLQLSRQSWESLPPISLQVCKIQLVAWMAWFPITYYSSTYIYQTFVISDRVHLGTRDDGAFELGQSDYRLIEVARLCGSFSVLSFASVSFLTSLCLPAVTGHMAARRRRPNRAWHDVGGMPLSRLLVHAQRLLAFCMFLTLFAWTVPVATAIVSVAGVSWAVSMWVPFALINAEIADMRNPSSALYVPGEQAGWILGMHNMAISLPQLASALVCSVLFKVFESFRVLDGVAWAFRLSGVAMLVSSRYSGKLESMGV